MAPGASGASASPASCPNCGAPSEGRYCPACGQDNRIVRLDTAQIAKEVFQNLVGWDSALGHTLKGLFRSPGRLAAEYVSGRRRRFVNPARFCLLSLAFWFLASRVLFVDPMDASGIRLTASSGGEAARLMGEVRAFLGRHLDVLMFLSLPLRAVLLRLFFRRAQRNVAECLVPVLYVAGVGYLFGMLFVPFLALGHEWVARLRPILTLVWSYWAALGFFGKGWFATLWRMAFVSMLHTVGTFVFFGLVALPWVLWTR